MFTLSRKTARYIAYTIIALRIIVPFFIFVDGFWVAIWLLLLDGFDFCFIKEGRVMNKTTYQKYDKILDIYYLSFLFIFSLQWHLYLLTILFVWRLIGVIAFFISKDRKTFVIFQNLFEPVYDLYAFGFVHSVFFLGFLQDNIALIMWGVFILKTLNELYVHYYEGKSLFYLFKIIKQTED